MNRIIGLVLIVVVLMAGIPSSISAQQDGIKGVVFAPAIDLHAYIKTAYINGKTWNMQGVGQGVVWLEGTAWLNHTKWRIVLAGHTPGGFEDLHELKRGDAITLTDFDLGISITFYVTRIVIADALDIEWVMPTQDLTLTLITCIDGYRLIVEAQP